VKEYKMNANDYFTTPYLNYSLKPSTVLKVVLEGYQGAGGKLEARQKEKKKKHLGITLSRALASAPFSLFYILCLRFI